MSVYEEHLRFEVLHPGSCPLCTKLDSWNDPNVFFSDKKWGENMKVNFCEFFINVCEFFIKFCGILKNFMKKKREKLEIDCFFPLLIKEMGHFKNPLWCTVDKTQGAKIQIWGTGHKLTSIRNSGNFILSIFMHRGQRYDSAKFSSCYLNTLYQS